MAVNKPVGDNAQGRREEALAAQDQSDGQRHLDETGEFLDQKKAPAKKPFKGVRKEKSARKKTRH